MTDEALQAEQTEQPEQAEQVQQPEQAAPVLGVDRPSWDEYFMTLANQVASRTTCTRRAVGCVIVKDKRILATGYNGVPTGLRHCAETGCLRQELGIPSGQRHEICRGLHAEQNAIIFDGVAGRVGHYTPYL